jgi:hypothetical protein
VVSQDDASIYVPILETMTKSSQIASFLWIPGSQKEEEDLDIRSLEERTSGTNLNQVRIANAILMVNTCINIIIQESGN